VWENADDAFEPAHLARKTKSEWQNLNK